MGYVSKKWAPCIGPLAGIEPEALRFLQLNL
jgi:hypothetical protein